MERGGGGGNFQDFDKIWQEFAVRMQQLRNAIANNVHQLLIGAQAGSASGPAAIQSDAIWILGTEYKLHPEATGEGGSPSRNPSRRSEYHVLYWTHFRSILWMTYRTDFPPLVGSGSVNSYLPLTSDVGWGCMVRSTQSMLATGLCHHLLGRDWRLGASYEQRHYELYQQIVKWFVDSPSDECLFSIHHVARIGASEKYGISVGQWYGPNTISRVLVDIIERRYAELNVAGSGIRAHVTTDRCLFKDEILSKFSSVDGSDECSLLLFVPVRLGTDQLNPLYYDQVKAQLKRKSTIGISGGRPNSALFFLGIDGNDLLHLDPHFPRRALPLQSHYTVEDLLSYHCDVIRRTRLGSMDPSLVIGHYFQRKQDFVDFYVEMSHVPEEEALFSILENQGPVDESLEVYSIESE